MKFNFNFEDDLHIDAEFYDIRDELMKIKKKYENEYENLEREVAKKCAKQLYSSGGLMLHRGFYCPSPIIEKICGNVTRGKMISKPGKTGYTYFLMMKIN